MTVNRMDMMRLGRASDRVVLQEYNNFRSTRPGKMIFSFEGYDDVIFYEVMVEKCGYKGEYDSFVCNGKDRVLALRRLLSRNTSEDAIKTAFFIDHDFDGLKGEETSGNIYCTDTYSIENYLTESSILKKILRGEFRCVEDSEIDDIERVVNFYQEMFDRFFEYMEEVNLIIFYLRSNHFRGESIDNDVEKYVKISEKGVEAKASTKEVIRLVGAEGHLQEESLPMIKEELADKFSALTPAKHWRGKFNLALFQKVLGILKEDRGRRPPRIFATRKSISVQFDGNIIRQLASAALPPESLKSFMAAIETA